MSFSNAAETAILALIFNATAWANIADNAASSPFTNIYLSGHVADPGEAGVQNTSPLTYTGYAYTAIARTSGGWTVSGATASNAAQVTLPACTAGSSTFSHFGLGWSSSGAGVLLGSGALTASLAISAGITPTAAIGAITVTLD